MNKICTSIEQSKKLIELGIDINTADMIVTNYPLQDGNRFYFICCKLSNDEFPSITDGKSEKIPAWSLSALMNLLPSEFTEVGKYSTTTYKIKIRKYKLTDEVNLHQIAYGSYKWHEDGGYTWSDMINTGEREELLDSVFEMVCLLLEKELGLSSELNTVEVKYVDLEKEISDYLTSYHLHIKDGGRVVFDNDDSPNFMCDIRHIAKHFYELGLKAKGE